MATTDPRFVPVLLALPSLTPSLALEVLPHGVTFHRLYVQADGRTHDVLVGPEDPADHLRQKYTNTIVGRYANRLPVPATDDPTITATGAHILSKGTAQSQFTPRANEAPTVSLHGGVQGWDSHVWEPVLSPYEAKLFTPAEVATIESELPGQTSVIFRRYSEDGEEGFPGRVLCEVFVALVPPKGVAQEEEACLGSVVVLYRAKLEDEGKVTPINLTQHWGFNLDASLQDGEPTVKNHHIDIKAKHIVALDSAALATGELLPVAGTHHDHAAKPSFVPGKGSLIGEGFDKGYDEFYVFENPSDAIPTRLPADILSKEGDVGATDPVKNALKNILSLSPRTLRESAPVSLSSDKSGLSLVFTSNQSGVQFYSNNLTAPSKNARKRIHGGTGTFGSGGYDVGSAAFLEFHAPLAAFLHPALKEAAKGEDTLLQSGEVYNNFVRVDVWFRRPSGQEGE